MFEGIADDKLASTQHFLRNRQSMQVSADTIEQLLQQSRKFYIGENDFAFDNDEPIFFRAGPYEIQKSIKKCPSCKEPFKSQKEMVYCTYCGLSNCKACTQKTRIYPNSQVDESGVRTSRGTICKLCDRKFFIKNIVRASSKEIATQNIAIKAIKKNLEALCDDAQR